jgi:hypothetical protein
MVEHVPNMRVTLGLISSMVNKSTKKVVHMP